ncbi:unnamed protein product [Kluyveromyces dobzhanskii CBS 2104]|uniref:WGS project CCBQ000000000 data, contig 00058 n=1 Tax=Kluyveromyces dobzhanskii CBS 2104 TaxID=1427455 RepID=A0A0A8LDB0_9SACH|nr:unnamed protein product [Kluyveromyces dobzhanskii CBS 2104]
MQQKKLIPLLATISLALAGTEVQSAPVVYENPEKACYLAEFPHTGSDKVGGYITFTSLDGIAKVNVRISSLEPNLQYHIHEKPVNQSDSTCASTKEHLNPYNGVVPCGKDISKCEVGDLSGKYGNIDSSYYETEYLDPYLSLIKGSPSYVGGKSITLHYTNGTRFACADIVPCRKLKPSPKPSKEEEPKEDDLKEEEPKEEEPKEEQPKEEQPKEEEPKEEDKKTKKEKKKAKKEEEKKKKEELRKQKEEEKKAAKEHSESKSTQTKYESSVTEEKRVDTSFTKKPHHTTSAVLKEGFEKKKNETSSEWDHGDEYRQGNGTDHSTILNNANSWKKTSSIGSVIAFIMSLLV